VAVLYASKRAAVNRSPKRTRKGVASIEIVINMLASAVNWAVINDRAVLKRMKPNSPH
jgi:hypothetical protein